MTGPTRRPVTQGPPAPAGRDARGAPETCRPRRTLRPAFRPSLTAVVQPQIMSRGASCTLGLGEYRVFSES
jgi:hypothetical protein